MTGGFYLRTYIHTYLPAYIPTYLPTYRQNGQLKPIRALFHQAKIITFTSIAFLPEDGNVIIGTAVGSFYLFKVGR